MNDWLMRMLALDKDDLSDLSKILILCWQMWNDRNNFVFKQIKPHPTHYLIAVATIGKEFLKANLRQKLRKNKISSNTISWKAPAEAFYKLNFDGLVEGSSAAAGFIIRNHRGQHSLMGVRHLRPNTITMSEAQALRDALALAKQHQIKKIMVEGDSKVVIDTVSGKCAVPWRIRFIVEDIKWLASSFELVEWNHVYREANFTKDVITSLGHNCIDLYIWDECIPTQAKKALLYDSQGLGCLRGCSLI
ncbi:uncharacterized protein LOC126590297 [Malus sylvestris]|uniref:uncharacterized protein LOC126590297 n=1 Tax=Malus sylvestris TaxID=3752 RepID=UPI0021ACDB74|nr:uncharacterized protein LOC126590297 [Malus sylvestris]